jgi:hypothetical protein
MVHHPLLQPLAGPPGDRMPHEPDDRSERDLAAIDWDALRRTATRLLHLRMRGFSAEEIEDAVQGVSSRYLSFVRRQGLPHTPEGLLTDLCRKVAASAILQRQRERHLLQQPPPDWTNRVDPSSDGDSDEDVLHDYRSIVFFVREYFALRRAQCTPLADAKAAGEPLKDFAARTQQSYEKVRQDWSRCVRLIHEAMRRNRLRLPWPTPRKRKRDDA